MERREPASAKAVNGPTTEASVHPCPRRCPGRSPGTTVISMVLAVAVVVVGVGGVAGLIDVARAATAARGPDLVFSDDFESGDLCGWSSPACSTEADLLADVAAGFPVTTTLPALEEPVVGTDFCPTADCVATYTLDSLDLVPLDPDTATLEVHGDVSLSATVQQGSLGSCTLTLGDDDTLTILITVDLEPTCGDAADLDAVSSGGEVRSLGFAGCPTVSPGFKGTIADTLVGRLRDEVLDLAGTVLPGATVCAVEDP